MKLFTISGFFIPCLRIPFLVGVVTHAYNPSSLKAMVRGSLLEASTFYIASFSQSCLARSNSKEQAEKRECKLIRSSQILRNLYKRINCNFKTSLGYIVRSCLKKGGGEGLGRGLRG